MSDAVRCDWCGKFVQYTAEATQDWIGVKLLGLTEEVPNKSLGDFCSIAHAALQMIFKQAENPHSTVSEVLLGLDVRYFGLYADAPAKIPIDLATVETLQERVTTLKVRLDRLRTYMERPPDQPL